MTMSKILAELYMIFMAWTTLYKVKSVTEIKTKTCFIENSLVFLN